MYLVNIIQPPLNEIDIKVQINKVIRPKSRASALSEKSGRQTEEQTKTFKKTFELVTTFKKTFELATKSLKNIFVTNQWTDRQMDRRTDRQTNKKVAHRGV